jgi:hypothetical protein
VGSIGETVYFVGSLLLLLLLSKMGDSIFARVGVGGSVLAGGVVGVRDLNFVLAGGVVGARDLNFVLAGGVVGARDLGVVLAGGVVGARDLDFVLTMGWARCPDAYLVWTRVPRSDSACFRGSTWPLHYRFLFWTLLPYLASRFCRCRETSAL